MAYLSIDTETTGLPPKGCRDYKNIIGFDSCRMVSIAIVLYSAEHEEISHYHTLIQPEGFQVTATEIHGITHEQAVTEGKPFSEVYSIIYKLFSQEPMILGYNLKFDMDVIMSEVYRRDLNMFSNKFTGVCAYKMAQKVNGGRHIRLGEAYKMLTGLELEGWHGALADARAAAAVYKAIQLIVPNVHKNLFIRRVILKASEVAACIGKNPYKKRGDVMDDMWKKYSPDTFTGTTKTDRALKIISGSDEAQNALMEAMKSRAEKSADTQIIVSEAAAKIQADPNMSVGQKREVMEHIRGSVYTTFGTRSEDKTSDKVEAEDGVKLVKDDKFYELEIAVIFGTRYVIVGKIDRIEEHEDGSKVLVEIKNRTRGLFHDVRPYEMIQVQTYLQMIHLDKARLIEQWNDEVHSQEILKDQNHWDSTVVPKLKDFCNELHSKMSV